MKKLAYIKLNSIVGHIKRNILMIFNKVILIDRSEIYDINVCDVGLLQLIHIFVFTVFKPETEFLALGAFKLHVFWRFIDAIFYFWLRIIQFLNQLFLKIFMSLVHIFFQLMQKFKWRMIIEVFFVLLAEPVIATFGFRFDLLGFVRCLRLCWWSGLLPCFLWFLLLWFLFDRLALWAYLFCLQVFRLWFLFLNSFVWDVKCACFGKLDQIKCWCISSWFTFICCFVFDELSYIIKFLVCISFFTLGHFFILSGFLILSGFRFDLSFLSLITK